MDEDSLVLTSESSLVPLERGRVVAPLYPLPRPWIGAAIPVRLSRLSPENAPADYAALMSAQ